MMLRRFPLATLLVLAGQLRHARSAKRRPRPGPWPSRRRRAPCARPAPATTDWRDWPATPGDWSYATNPLGSAARFGHLGSVPMLTLSCERAPRQVHLTRYGSIGGAWISRSGRLRRCARCKVGRAPAAKSRPRWPPTMLCSTPWDSAVGASWSNRPARRRSSCPRGRRSCGLPRTAGGSGPRRKIKRTYPQIKACIVDKVGPDFGPAGRTRNLA